MLARILFDHRDSSAPRWPTPLALPPHSGFEPPRAEKAAPSPGAPERPRRLPDCRRVQQVQATGRYAESLALYRQFASASPFAETGDLGSRTEGREIIMLIAQGQSLTPEAALKPESPSS